MIETWCGIEGFPSYAVSNYGMVKNVVTDKILSQETHDQGYRTVRLYKEGKVNKKYVHRLVAQAFLSNPNNRSEVNHIDNNRTNNHYTNLEWTTRKENVQHAIDNGSKQGLRSDDVVKIYIDIHYNDLSISEVADKYKVSKKIISSIKNKRSYKDILDKISIEKKIIFN